MFDSCVCPVCASTLFQLTSDSLGCSSCSEEYRQVNGIPILIPRQAYESFPIMQVQQIYDRAYNHPGIMGTQFDPEYSRVTKTTLLDLCKDAPNARLLDVGTGDGDLWEFAQTDTVKHGIDLSQTGIQIARNRYPDLHGAVAVSEWVPYPDSYFGAVTAVDSIEHSFDLSKSLESIRRVLTPNGILALSVPTPNSLRKWGYNRIVRGSPSLAMLVHLTAIVFRRTLLFGRPTFQPIDRDITLGDWRTTLERSGFRVTSVQEWPNSSLKPIVSLLAARVVK